MFARLSKAEELAKTERAGYECDGNEFRSSYLLKTKTRERGEAEDERSDYTRRGGSLTWRAVHFDMTEENTESTSPSRQKRTNSLHLNRAEVSLSPLFLSGDATAISHKSTSQ